MAQTQGQALVAFGVIVGMGKRATGKTAYALFKLKTKLKECIDFQAEEEEKLIEFCNGTVTDAGKIVIEDKEKLAHFVREKNRIAALEVDPEIEKIRIDPAQIPDITIDEIEALSNFVEFE